MLYDVSKFSTLNIHEPYVIGHDNFFCRITFKLKKNQKNKTMEKLIEEKVISNIK